MPGEIACFGAASWNIYHGHLVYVDSATNEQANISEYNYNQRYGFGTRPGVVHIDESGFLDDMLTAALSDCGGSADVFQAWLARELPPALSNGAAPAMGSASCHESERIQEAIAAAGRLLEHPPHSPGLDTMEHEWAQAKSLERKPRCPTDEIFRQATPQSFHTALTIGGTYRAIRSSGLGIA